MTERSETERAELDDAADDLLQAVRDLIDEGLDDCLPSADIIGNVSLAIRLAAQDQKPVAFLHETEWGDKSLSFEPAKNHLQWKDTPLYIAPPPAAGWDVEALRPLMKAGKIMAVCEFCSSSHPEGCGHYDLDDLRETPEGAWVCESCWDDSGDKPIWEDLPHVEALRHNAPPDSGAGESADATDMVDAVVYGVGISLGGHHVSLDQYYEPPTKSVPPDHGGADAGVQVKPLKWTNLCAGSHVGVYAVAPWPVGSFTMKTPRRYDRYTLYETVEEAKAAAQADYESCILSALSMPAPVAANASAEARLREALEKIAGSHFERTGHCQTDVEEVPDLTAEDAMREARKALSPDPHASDCEKQGETTKSEGGVEGHAHYGAPTDASKSDSHQPGRLSEGNGVEQEAGIKPGPSDRPADVTRELCSDCPPAGYETDRTRCVTCPRRDAFTVGRR